jgi:hypothetical protein
LVEDVGSVGVDFFAGGDIPLGGGDRLVAHPLTEPFDVEVRAARQPGGVGMPEVMGAP